MSKLVLFDIDGVLANETHRVHYALSCQWINYFRPDLVSKDSVWEIGREIAPEYEADGWEIGYLTGRRYTIREVTSLWLEKNGFPNGILHMRGRGIQYPLAAFKLQFLRKILDEGEYDEVLLLDDDPEVIEMIHRLLGREYAYHCTWHIKQKALVRRAVA